MPGTGGTLGVLEQARLRHRRRPERRHLGLRHALRRRHAAARAPISRSSRRPTTTRPTARTSRAATTGSPVRSRSCRRAGWAAGWTPTARPRTRCRPSRSTRTSPSRSARSKAPVCALEGLQGVGFSVPGVTGDVNSEVGKLATVPFAHGQRRARPLARHVGPDRRRRQPADEHPGRRAGPRLPAQQRPLAEAAARSHAALGRARHARRHDRLGQLRHARRPARRAGSRSSRRSRARWPRSRPT